MITLRQTTAATLLRLLVVILLTAGCDQATGSPANPAVCDGIPADMGGCDSARPVFVGETCEAIADEWVVAIDGGVIKVIRGQPVVDGMQRSSRISNVLAGMRLDELGLLETCDAPTFLEAAKTDLSDDLRAGIGATLFDGQPFATQGDWEEILFRAIRIVDEGE